MRTQIFVFQSGATVALAVQLALESIPGLDSNRIVMLNRLWDMEGRVTPGSRQLFITDSNHGDTSEIAEFVSRLRAMNPYLVCMSYSADPLPGPFDFVIPKENGDNLVGLIAAADQFLIGEINRSDPDPTATQLDLSTVIGAGLPAAMYGDPLTCPRCGHVGVVRQDSYVCLNCGEPLGKASAQVEPA